MRKIVLLLASMALAVLLACMAAALTAVPGAGRPQTVTLVGAGDIADCNTRADSATAKLVGRIPGTVISLGDNAYPHGTAAQFRNCYDPPWGRFKKRTLPTAGNRDYDTTGARPYFNYFGARAGKPGRGYYSYDRGAWHIVALNSNCDEVRGCGSRSPQGRWLRRDLANHRSRCTLAYFHHPLYASGTGFDHPEVKPFWNMLHGRRAEVILAGHAHWYERFAPITPKGARSAHGIRQFIVGTGGTLGGRQHGPNDPNVQVKKFDTAGVLRLELRAGSYHWKFVSIAGESFTDSGRDQCH